MKMSKYWIKLKDKLYKFSIRYTCLSTISLLSPDGHSLHESESMTSASKMLPVNEGRLLLTKIRLYFFYNQIIIANILKQNTHLQYQLQIQSSCQSEHNRGETTPFLESRIQESWLSSCSPPRLGLQKCNKN